MSPAGSARRIAKARLATILDLEGLETVRPSGAILAGLCDAAKLGGFLRQFISCRYNEDNLASS